jgi:hypothetical protein
MADTKWDRDLAKIDKQLESISDEALFPTKGDAPAATRAANVDKQHATSTLGVVARLTLATLLALGVLFWPYDHTCGLQLLYYLAAVSVVTVAGFWSAIWSWRHRSGRAHVLSLVLAGFGLVLGGLEILPRIGYAAPGPEGALTWTCQAPPTVVPTETPPTTPPPPPATPAPSPTTPAPPPPTTPPSP